MGQFESAWESAMCQAVEAAGSELEELGVDCCDGTGHQSLVPLGEIQDDVGLQNRRSFSHTRGPLYGRRGHSAGSGGAGLKGSGVPLYPGTRRRDEWMGWGSMRHGREILDH